MRHSLRKQRGFLGISAGGAALLGGGLLGPIVGGVTGSNAAGQQVASANRGQDILSGEFQQTRQDLSPFMQAGNVSLQQLMAGLQPGGQFNHMFGLQDFQQSPAYQFNLQQGQMAIDKASNARGNLYAPQTLKDLSTFTQGMASNEFQNAFNNYRMGTNDIFSRLSGVSNLGENAAAGVGTIGANVAGGIADLSTQAGNARAGGTMAIGNAAQGGINNLTNLALLSQLGAFG